MVTQEYVSRGDICAWNASRRRPRSCRCSEMPLPLSTQPTIPSAMSAAGAGRHLSENAEAEFRRLTGEEPADFITRLQQLPMVKARRWLGTITGLGQLLDAKWE